MSLIVAGRFTTYNESEPAAGRLFEAGLLQEDVTLFFVKPRGQHARFAVGGYQYADPQASRASVVAGKGGVIGAVIGAVVGVAIFSLFSAPFIVLIAAAGVTKLFFCTGYAVLDGADVLAAAGVEVVEIATLS